ncbi:ferrous iron transport protein B [Leifsonia xyli subsp. cynodontis DSM 46306]|jgi:ferrous iron transport protein B|uniref:FeoB-type G domain-containing protein n=1 Tax=Leifsonia xyli subsp. cynodontis DSM 46306 TaxID=1389489 RepID=U3P537_LEIXC|nr:ferrous iron transporter B [Leifsonia xyli]AGW40579.1 ferrous iron transport protein B [Leifsonia xyli subsp. cynodontis DSM 46306]
MNAVETPTTLALVGQPNTGKSSVFNLLTGLTARTGNYPGITVARKQGTFQADGRPFVVEDLPGTYSLTPLSPDEAIVTARLGGEDGTQELPDALLVVIDSTRLEQSLVLLGQILQHGIRTAVVLTMTDELARRGGSIDVDSLERAIGAPVISAVATRRSSGALLREFCSTSASWSAPLLPPPADREELVAWTRSVAAAAGHRPPGVDRTTDRADALLLHPVVGVGVFACVMFVFFQLIFTVAAPAQDAITDLCGQLATLVDAAVPWPWLASLLADGVIGGVGTVVAFLPQIALMLLMLAFLQDSGYLSRAAFLMDRVMSQAGLEGRAFVALLSSFACAIPGIMATRTLPSARHRIATMVAAPLVTCSARLPVYVLLVGMLVSPHARFGPFQAQGLVMFALYLFGAVVAMAASWVVARLQGGRRSEGVFFSMEMPPYRRPTLRSLALSTWAAIAMFLRKCGTIILAASVVMWLLLNIAAPGAAVARSASASAPAIDRSVAAEIGRFVEPVFEPLGFDWHINVAVLASLTARETFVSTLGQIAAADDADHPASALRAMERVDEAGHSVPLFSPGTIAALIVFFMFALQCMSTIAVMRRESGGWRWPLIAFGSMFALAWTGAWIANIAFGWLSGTA